MVLRAISLFTGAGGLDYGFEAAGYTTVAAVEYDKDCISTLKSNRPKWPVMQADINDVTAAQVLSVARGNAEDVDVLIGGPPCQPFSKSGYWATGDSARLHDPRASTLMAYLRILREVRPRAFLIENVEGLGFRGKDEGLKLILNQLEEINRAHGTSYSASVQVLNAADYGVPQIRRRLLIVGSRDGRLFQFPRATHFDPSLVHLQGARAEYRTAWDALHDVPTPNEDHSVGGKWADLLPTIPEGSNYLWHTSRGGGVPLFGWRRRFWNFLLKSAKDRPSWTIQAQPGPATGPFHWDNRRFSRDELMRLQTFPRDITINGSLSVAQRQIGNAVPSLLAEVIGREISAQLLGRKRWTTKLRLEVEKAPTIPTRERVQRRVPAKYLHLQGDHSPHPGTGLGASASLRNDSLAA
jgi:DNA (cytosine-5)-methyltransferase 1